MLAGAKVMGHFVGMRHGRRRLETRDTGHGTKRRQTQDWNTGHDMMVTTSAGSEEGKEWEAFPQILSGGFILSLSCTF